VTSSEVPRHPRAAGLLLGGVLTGLLLAAGSLLLWTLAATPGPVRTDTQQQSYTQAIGDIDVELTSSSLTLVTRPAGAVGVQRQLTWARGKPVVSERLVGRTLQIRAQCPRSIFGYREQCRADYALEVPPGVAVRATLFDGDIRADGLTGALQLSTFGGDITVTGTHGSLSAHTDQGSIVGSDLNGRDVDVKSSNADIDLRFAVVPDHVQVDTVDGDVSIAVPVAGNGADGYQVRAYTRDGRRDVNVQEDSTGRHAIVAYTVRGNVTVRNTSLR
jgi:hypothetical protein